MAGKKELDAGRVREYFESLSDPRHERNRLHLLADIIVISICAIVSGCEGPTAIHRWARCREDWLRRFLPLPHGIPSRDCIRRTLILISPQAFQKCFESWLRSTVSSDENHGGGLRLVAIDGKTCRGSHDRGQELGPMHIVSAWASEEGLALGQVATEEKSNEITAIPLLLQQIDLKQSLVTIDAMGCQKEIAEQIHRGKGVYVLTVKDNQPKLLEHVQDLLREHLDAQREDLRYRHVETRDEGHGRVDERGYLVVKVPVGSPIHKEWPSVSTVGCSTRVTTHADGRETEQTRYYILNRFLSGRRFREAVRGHWSIESMHWVLDVVFREDENQSANRALVSNFSWLRRFAISLIKRHPEKESIKGRMQMSGWSTDFLEQVLLAQ